jgi:hypothetical protein
MLLVSIYVVGVVCQVSPRSSSLLGSDVAKPAKGSSCRTGEDLTQYFEPRLVYERQGPCAFQMRS